MFYPGSRETTAVKRLQLFRGREIGAAFFFSSAADDSAGKLGTSLRGVSESSTRILLRVSRRCHMGGNSGFRRAIASSCDDHRCTRSLAGAVVTVTYSRIEIDRVACFQSE